MRNLPSWDIAALLDINKTVTSTATPEALAGSRTLFQSVTISGNKAAQTANTSTAYLGSATSQDIPIAPGEIIQIIAPEGKQLDLADFFLDVGTNGDGVRGQRVR